MNRTRNFLSSQECDYTRLLVQEFLDGITTPEQERWLYAFYRNHNPGSLPADLESYRGMFGWYASLPSTAKPRRRLSGARIAAFTGIAAAAAIAVGTGLSLINRNGRTSAADSAYASYAGSYIVRDGQRIDDIVVIYDEVSAAATRADSLANDSIALEKAISNINDDELSGFIRSQIFTR